MWTVLKNQVCARGPSYLIDIQRCCQEKLLKTQPEDYQKLVDGYKKHPTEVKMAMGHLAKL